MLGSARAEALSYSAVKLYIVSYTTYGTVWLHNRGTEPSKFLRLYFWIATVTWTCWPWLFQLLQVFAVWLAIGRILKSVRLYVCLSVRGDWNCENGHRETIKIVGTDIARLDNARPYRKGGHRETWQRGTRSNIWCTIFMLHGISGLYELHLSVCTTSSSSSQLRRYTIIRTESVRIIVCTMHCIAALYRL